MVREAAPPTFRCGASAILRTRSAKEAVPNTGMGTLAAQRILIHRAPPAELKYKAIKRNPGFEPGTFTQWVSNFRWVSDMRRYETEGEMPVLRRRPRGLA